MRDITYPPVILTMKAAFRLLGQRIQMSGTEHVPRTGGVMLAVNHIGYVDFVYGGLAANPLGIEERQVRSWIQIYNERPLTDGFSVSETHAGGSFFRLWRFYAGPPPGEIE